MAQGGARALATRAQTRAGRTLRLPARTPWIVLLTLAALALALEFVHPAASTAPTIRAAAETAMTLLGLAAAFLVAEQFVQTRRLRELLLLGALATLATTEFVANGLPAALHLHSTSGFTAMPPVGQLIVAGLLAAAAMAPSDRLMTGRARPIAWVGVLSVGAVGVAELGGLLLRNLLVTDARSSQPGIDRAWAHPLGFALLLVSVALFVFAAWEFYRRGRLHRDRIVSLVAGAAALLASAQLYFLAMPGVSPGTVTFREAMRLLAFGLIFAAALTREFELRSTMARAAAISERRRVAQDLHDGLAQDLALIAAHQTRMAEQFGAEHPVVVAASRALAISRGTISELSYKTSSSVSEALEAVRRELGTRFDVDIDVDVQLESELSPEARNHVARIAREAIANAVRHGDAHHIVVTLMGTSAGISLRVRDDGCGIRHRSGNPRREGFGLRCMRGRAAALGGSFAVRSGANRGTEIEVVFS